jgi:hypothetical protein
VLSIATRLTHAVPQAASDVFDRSRAEGLEHPILTALRAALVERASSGIALLGR